MCNETNRIEAMHVHRQERCAHRRAQTLLGQNPCTIEDHVHRQRLRDHETNRLA